MEKYLYKGWDTIYSAEDIFVHKQTEGSDIIEIKMYRVPISEKNREGISYSLVFIRNEERIIGFDIAEAIDYRTFVSPQLDSERHVFCSNSCVFHYNCEKHEKDGNYHHKHVRGKIIPYVFIDEWKLLQDFNEEVEKIRKGIIK